MTNIVRRGRPAKSRFSVPQTEENEVDEVTEITEQLPEGIVERPALRPALRAESPRDRATRRAAEVRGHIGSMDEGTDEFYIDPSIVPDGWSYEWKTKTVLGAEDPAYQVSLARKGWEPVEATRHPELMPSGFKDTEIGRKGMVLMERPLELTEEARRIEQRRARLQVRHKEEQLAAAPGGQFERNNKDSSLIKVKKSWEKIPVLDD